MLIKVFVCMFYIATVFTFPPEKLQMMDPARDFYKDIVDIRHPTKEELLVLQNKLLHTYRPILEWMGDTAFIPREFRFISNNPLEIPELGQLVLNSQPDDRENCIILYASFNQRYPDGVRRLLQRISSSDYKGHVYYRIGGWPNIEAGDLRLAHVPFAFKPCFFKEMQAKGYKRVLWLDAAILPSPGVSLNTIFDMIKRKGFFIQAGDHPIGIFMNEKSAEAFGLTLHETSRILSCSAAIIGVDFTQPRTVSLVDTWYQAADHPFAYFSARSDQNALSILIHKMGLTGDMISRKLLGSVEHPEGSLFIMDRPYVKDERNN